MKKEMTEDTRRAIEIISPLANELNISIKATESLLFMNGQAIGISCNSTYATLMEIIGWIFLGKYCHDFRAVDIDWNEAQETIMRYWVTNDVLKKIGGLEE